MSTPGASFGGAGGAFSQAFAQTLLHGSQIIAQVQDRRDELDLRKKLVSAQLQEHDAKTELANRALKGAASLQSRMTAQSWPDSELGAGGTTTTAPLSEQERMQYALQIDPHAAAKSLLDPKQEGVAMFKDVLASGAFGGGATPSVTPAGGARGTTAESGGDGIAPKPDNTVTLSSDGKIQLKTSGGKLHISEHVMTGPDGKPWLYRLITDPQDSSRTSNMPLGPVPPPAELMKFSLMATFPDPTTGQPRLAEGTQLHQAAMADLIAASTLPANAQGQMVAGIRDRYTALTASNPKFNAGGATPATSAAPSTGNPVRDAITAANAQEVAQAGAKTKAEAQARLSVPEKASPAERDKLTNQLASGDLYGQIKGLYAPEMVGPLRGGPSAAVREKTGMMSQQEQQFRTAVTTANNQMIKDITGAQMSEPEAQRLMRQMPDPTLPANQFEARLKQTIVNQKIIAIRRRQVLEGTGVDVSNVPKVTLTTEERRQVAAPIAQDFKLGQITRQQAVQQLMGLGQYGEQGAHALLTVIEQGNR